MTAVLDDDIASENRSVVDQTVTGRFGSVPQDTVVSDHRIVGDMDSLQQKVPISDAGLVTGKGCTVDNYFFADRIVVADNQFCRISREFKVLWSSTDDGTLIDDVVVSHACAVENAGIGHDRTVVSDHYVLIDVGERMDGYVLTDLGGRIDIG